MNQKEIRLHVGEGFDAMAERVARAWHRAEKGENLYEHHTSFISWDLLSKVMTSRRYELLRYVHRHPAKNVATLAREIDRDYKRVYEDVSALEAAGLIQRENGMVRADYDYIASSIQL